MPKTLTCLHCDRSFADVRPHLVDTLPGQGLVAWCLDCDPLLTLGEKKSYITHVINHWRSGLLCRDYDAIEDMGHRYVEFEQKKDPKGFGNL